MITNEQQKILDKLCLAFLQSRDRIESLRQQLEQATRDGIIAESKFKGVVEAFGGETWKWDGQHVEFVEPALPLNGESAKIPGE